MLLRDAVDLTERGAVPKTLKEADNLLLKMSPRRA